jgi:hypothetical protein
MPRRRRGAETRPVAVLPELRSIRLRETDTEVVVEMAVPPEIALPQLAAEIRDGVLTISVPRCASGASAPSP